MTKIYRQLLTHEITQLEAQGCSCKNWGNIEVVTDFLPDRVRESSFSGHIKLGRFERVFELPGGFCKRAGIRNVAFHNVEVGDDCYIENVHNYIANYSIGTNCFIENVDVIFVDGFCTFGNGVEATVLNETGGREVIISDKLSAQLAYFSALYRHRPKLIDKLHTLTKFYAQKHGSNMGYIGNNCWIVNTGKIEGVRIGSYSRIEGAALLVNGSINSVKEYPSTVGVRVRARDFILSSGARLDSGCSIERCFIGQSSILANGYMATDSVFFANCHGENGEACSVFAGPFTVSHHKSSLLIAGLFSFMNTGSGSNQSNHMYKLGPIHQGIMERGAKTTSDSYILWPAHIGAFSLVMGRHVFHADTSNLPFSYLIEKNNTTFLIPGVNLRSVGTIRDAQKWPKRDKRSSVLFLDEIQENSNSINSNLLGIRFLRKVKCNPDRLDQINYNLLSPYTIQKMFNGIEILESLKRASGVTTDVYSYHSAKINNSSLNKGLEYYNIAIRKFLGNSIIKRLEKYGTAQYTHITKLSDFLVPTTDIGTGEWVDISGLIAPKSSIELLLSKIEAGEISRLGEINDFIATLHANYYEYEWTWSAQKIEEFFNVNLKEITAEKIIKIVECWKEAVIKLDNMVYEDAKKEFSLAVMASFGADGSESEKAKDFAMVRGEFNNNPFVEAILKHIDSKNALGDELIERLRS
ncbi:MAG: DUF4954 family protein [Bacteroidales bacterium]